MIKVVLFTHTLQHYRVPIFNILSKNVDLTVVCNNADLFEKDNLSFKLLKVNVKKFGPFLIHTKSPQNIARSHDVAIGLMNIRCLDLFFMAINPLRKFSFIYWGIGVNASYTKQFDDKDISHYIRLFFSKFSDAVIFYSSYPKKYYKYIIDSKSIFIANNTVEVINNDLSIDVKKSNLLFVGTVYKQKGLDELIDYYYKVYKSFENDIPDLIIVGDGDADILEKLKLKVKIYSLSDKIHFKGKITNQQSLSKIFSQSLACISPKQAGLSVLTSMGYGVPFITSKNAITGGEIFNIQNNVNGVIINDIIELESVLVDLITNPQKYYDMGKKAKSHYLQYRQPFMMANSIYEAVKYAVKRS